MFTVHYKKDGWHKDHIRFFFQHYLQLYEVYKVREPASLEKHTIALPCQAKDPISDTCVEQKNIKLIIGCTNLYMVE